METDLQARPARVAEGDIKRIRLAYKGGRDLVQYQAAIRWEESEQHIRELYYEIDVPNGVEIRLEAA